ncbi:19383_t:CDS:2 [Dentiscutata erythropus]|uniref:19383_t:CDS:1 n=1 Tax=Dentiscutata erythropus TaxID=1348616 RepID=A0A9N9N6J1_9GLOM|nr:19383_t:CDS:2 [Dentiscutata erythropus]
MSTNSHSQDEFEEHDSPYHDEPHQDKSYPTELSSQVELSTCDKANEDMEVFYKGKKKCHMWYLQQAASL